MTVLLSCCIGQPTPVQFDSMIEAQSMDCDPIDITLWQKLLHYGLRRCLRKEPGDTRAGGDAPVSTRSVSTPARNGMGAGNEKPDGISESTSDKSDSIHRPASGINQMLDHLQFCGYAIFTKHHYLCLTV